MLHNITLRVMFFANADTGGEWRVYTDSGMYGTAKGVDDIPNTIKQLLLSDASQTARAMGEVQSSSTSDLGVLPASGDEPPAEEQSYAG